MLGLLLIFFIGKVFADMAGRYGKTKWPFAILGIAVYYVGTFIFGILLGLLNADILYEWSSLQIGLLAIPVGLLCCVIAYFITKNILSKNYVDPIENMYLDIEKQEEVKDNQNTSTAIPNDTNLYKG
jgi:hypothetical protein